MAKRRNRAKLPRVMRRDPTQTIMLRRQFSNEITRRFRRVQRAIIELILTEDKFGLQERTENYDPDQPTVNTPWRFRSDVEALKRFKDWLQTQFAAEILSQGAEDAYYAAYIQDGYRKGAGRAFDDQKKYRWGAGEGDFYKGSKQQFLKDSFGMPVAKEKVKLLAERTYTDLKGITSDMGTKMSRVLTDGLVQGKSPRVVARDLNKQLEIGRKRSLVIARTETVRAHAEGQLDAMELMGVEDIGVAVEWAVSGLGGGVTALGNPSPCDLCVSLDGVVMTVKEARGLLPRHPNCLCCYIPANVGEDTADQKRTKQEVKKAIDRSIRAEVGGKRTLAEQKERSRWAGSEKKISKRRPEEFVPTR